MKLRLDATQEELATRGEDLVEGLAKALQEHAPELADALQKALPPKETSLKHKSLRELHETVRRAYAVQMDRMNEELASLISADLKKSESPDYTTKVVAMDEAAYAKAKAAALQAGFHPDDFEADGILAELNTNQLREAIKERSAG